MRARAARTLLAALLCCQSALAQVTLTEGTDISVDVAPDGRFLMKHYLTEAREGPLVLVQNLAAELAARIPQ